MRLNRTILFLTNALAYFVATSATKKKKFGSIREIALPTSSFHSDAPVFRFSATGGKRVGSPVEKVIGRAFASRR